MEQNHNLYLLIAKIAKIHTYRELGFYLVANFTNLILAIVKFNFATRRFPRKLDHELRKIMAINQNKLFSRNLSLISKAEQEKLAETTIAIVAVGGNGGPRTPNSQFHSLIDLSIANNFFFMYIKCSFVDFRVNLMKAFFWTYLSDITCHYHLTNPNISHLC